MKRNNFSHFMNLANIFARYYHPSFILLSDAISESYREKYENIEKREKINKNNGCFYEKKANNINANTQDNKEKKNKSKN
jgi:hypothetical protein